MITSALIIAFFLSLTVAIFTLASAAVVPANGVRERLQVLLGRHLRRTPRTDVQQRAEQALEPLSRMLPRSAADTSRTRSWLIQAGLRDPRYLTMYYGSRILGLFGGIAIAGALSRFRSDRLLLVLCAGIFGYFLPRFLLKRRIRARQQAIQLGMPDALDLAVICVEAGLSLDHSLQRIGEELALVHPELSDEFRLITLEVQAGKTRAEALRNFALRVNIDDVRALVAVLLQTDRFGTSIATALRVHSDALRVERRQRAEEAAAKTTIKMVPVLVFFVFPPIFFVTLGPAIIQLIRTVLPELNK
jgi:tight adherence protein C